MPHEHPVLRKLKVSVVPYQISAVLLRRSPTYVLYTLYAYISDAAAALLGVGIASPILVRMAGGSATGPPPWLPPSGIAVLVAWAILKVYVAQSEGARIAPLRRSCRREFLRIGRQVTAALALPDPMPKLEELQVQIETIVDRHIAEGAWPWEGPAPGIEHRVEEELERISHSFAPIWEPPPPGDRTSGEPK